MTEDVEQVLSDSLEQKRSGDVLYAKGSYQEASDTYDAALSKLSQLAVEDEEPQRKRGVVRGFLLQSKAACMHKMHRYDEAVEACGEVLSSDPSNSKALLRRAQCHADAGQYAKAYIDFCDLQELQPSGRDLSQTLDDIRLRHPEAVEEAEEELAERRRRQQAAPFPSSSAYSVFQRAAVLVLSSVLGAGWCIVSATLCVALLQYAREDRSWELLGQKIVEEERGLVELLAVLCLVDPLLVDAELHAGRAPSGHNTRSLLVDRALSLGVWCGVLGLLPSLRRSALLFLLLLLALWSTRSQLRYPLQIIRQILSVPPSLSRAAVTASLFLQPAIFAVELAVVGQGWAAAQADIQTSQARPWIAWVLNGGMVVYPVLSGFSFHWALSAWSQSRPAKKGAQKRHAS